MPDSGYDFRVAVDGYYLSDDLARRIREVSIEETTENGVASTMSLIIDDSLGSDFPLELFALERRLWAEIRTTGRWHTLFLGAILSVEPTFGRDDPPSVRIYCEDFSYKLKKPAATKDTPEADPGSTYWQYLENKILRRRGFTITANGSARTILDQPVPDDEGFAFGGVETKSVEDVYQGRATLVKRTTIEFGDTLWLALAKFADRFGLILGSVGRTIVFGDQDFLFTPQTVSHRLVYDPTDEEAMSESVIPLLEFRPETSLKNNTQSIEISHWSAEKIPDVDDNPLSRWTNGIADRLKNESTAKRYQMRLSATPGVTGAALPGLPRFVLDQVVPQGVGASIQLESFLSEQSERSWHEIAADLLGWAEDQVVDATVASANFIRRFDFPDGVDAFLEDRLTDLRIAEEIKDRANQAEARPRQDEEPTVVDGQGHKTDVLARVAAEQLLKKSMSRLTTAEGIVRGTPTLRYGHEHRVDLRALGSLGAFYSGDYRMLRVRHVISESGYLTHFTATRRLAITPDGAGEYTG